MVVLLAVVRGPQWEFRDPSLSGGVSNQRQTQRRVSLSAPDSEAPSKFTDQDIMMSCL